jgi:hypothetical protein
MSINSVILKYKINSAGDFYPLSPLLKLIGGISGAVVFFAMSGHSPHRISWYFFILALPFILLSLGVGFFRFTTASEEENVSIS